MAHAPHLRDKARSLRIQHRLTIDELARRLALSRSTIYYWVRDLPIPGSGPGGGWPESARRKGTRAMRRKYRLLREEAYREGIASFDALVQDPTFRDFVCMYIGEGSKRRRSAVAICNSDPAVMRLAASWLKRLTSKPLIVSIRCHADQDLNELCGFWGTVVGIDPSVIRAQRKSNSNRLAGRNWRSAHGVLTLTAHDTLLRARMGAWIDRVEAEWR
ncbi:MAG TPA: hypothetical protein VEJ23_06835 [Solirubrobacteraceae bacterium]|nr:hypothetical protein [Solirubrobacteraceae bacterium]